MTLGDDSQPLSVRPPPVADRKPRNIADFIARVNAQPGGFRAISEAKLREEIAQENAAGGDSQHKDVDMAEADEDDNYDDHDATRDPQEVRMEMFKNLELTSVLSLAGNTALLTLDFLSLLISKQNPTQAGVTLSQGLRDMVGIGTIGADKLDNPPTTSAKTQEQENIALGFTLMQTNKVRDAAEAASSFLQKEVTSEGKYWEDIIAVQKSGWSITRVPMERHILGVRNSLAPMRRGDGGTVQLDCGKLGGVSERVVVTYEKNGQITGRSALPAETAVDAPLEEHVLEARNTIFSQELWHELTREARSLASYGVKPDGSRLTCDIDPASKSRIILELVPLGTQASSDDHLPDNQIAETISLALHILLGYAHRQNELMRTRPLPPHIARARGQQSHVLLRPIIGRLMHLDNVEVVTKHVGALVQSLQRAGVSSRFVLKTPKTSPSDSDPSNQGPNQLASSQTMMRNMLNPIEFNIKLTILPDVTCTVRGRTFHVPVTATYYSVILPPNSPLSSVCAPYKDGYPNPSALAHYLGTATSRLLVEHYLSKLSFPWTRSIQGNVIRNQDNEEFELSFAVTDTPALRVRSTSLVDGKLVRHEWTWSDDATKESVEAVVDQEIRKIRS
ncbi:calcium channel yvc1 [Fusarium flagelliforme]|uniref:Mediator of RNA polymerase II transcription subunit 17 n=1 Tax=Fusarium flagelliforme TaxID=2675880 RepID=A0A395MMG5_9HYPO|nr:calcium channel yvc1 [Fusarium flagelliforme]